jgi:outer membrane lipoprotein LolB
LGLVRFARRAAVLLALTLLAACISTPRPTEILSVEAERAALLALNQFAFDGRVAVSNGNTGSLSWQQRDDSSFLRMSGPLGIGAMQISVVDGVLRIASAAGDAANEGAAAEALIVQQLGFVPPWQSLRYWVLGQPAPDASSATPLVQQLRGDDGRLRELQQDDWRITYDEYRLQQLPRGAVQLPRRLTAARDGLRLKLVVDTWRLR